MIQNWECSWVQLWTICFCVYVFWTVETLLPNLWAFLHGDKGTLKASHRLECGNRSQTKQKPNRRPSRSLVSCWQASLSLIIRLCSILTMFLLVNLIFSPSRLPWLNTIPSMCLRDKGRYFHQHVPTAWRTLSCFLLGWGPRIRIKGSRGLRRSWVHGCQGTVCAKSLDPKSQGDLVSESDQPKSTGPSWRQMPR